MSCDCINSECIDLYVSPCDSGIGTGILLPVGDYTIITEFNGAYNTHIVGVVNNDQLVLPNNINLNYTHTLKIIQSDNTLYNDTCYKLKMHMVISVDKNLTPTPAPSGQMFITVLADGVSITDPYFATHTISEIDTNTQAYIRGVDFTQTGNEITGINGLSFSQGQIILARV